MLTLFRVAWSKTTQRVWERMRNQRRMWMQGSSSQWNRSGKICRTVLYFCKRLGGVAWQLDWLTWCITQPNRHKVSKNLTLDRGEERQHMTWVEIRPKKENGVFTNCWSCVAFAHKVSMWANSAFCMHLIAHSFAHVLLRTTFSSRGIMPMSWGVDV